MGLLRLLWARPTILLIGLAIGVVIGLNLMPDDMPKVATPAAASSPATPAVHASPAKAPIAATKSATAPILAPTPASPDVRLQLAKLATAGRTLNVGVFGDSLGDGVWAALYRDLHGDKSAGGGFNVIRLSQVSTGLSRYNYVDIQQKTVGQLAAQHIDIAVFMFGANDQQGIVEDGKIYPFGTDGWKAAYGRRVDNLVYTLRQQGAVIYWVGLPKMESHRFDDGSSLINAVLAQHMAALGAEFIPTVALTSDANGDYSAYLPEGGSKTKKLMRANDGIHMSMLGYLRITAPVAGMIRRDLASATPQAPTVVATPVTAPSAVTVAASAADAHP